MQEFAAARKGTMGTSIVNQPLGYAKFHLRSKDGEDALTTKAYTYADLHKIVGRLPVGLVFEVQLYCNDMCVGSGTYRRHNPHIEIEQESGACMNLWQGEFVGPPPSEAALP
jgi:hypothetical protein